MGLAILSKSVTADKMWLFKRVNEIREFFDQKLQSDKPELHRSTYAPLSFFYYGLYLKSKDKSQLARAIELRDLSASFLFKLDFPHLLEAGPMANYFHHLWDVLGESSPIYSLFKEEIKSKTLDVAKDFLIGKGRSELFLGAGGLLLLAHMQKSGRLERLALDYLEESLYTIQGLDGFIGPESFLKGAFENYSIEKKEQKKNRFVLGFAHGISGTLAALCLENHVSDIKRKRKLSSLLAKTLIQINDSLEGRPMPAVWPPVDFGLKIRIPSAWCNGDPGIGWALARYANVYCEDKRLEKSEAGASARKILLRSLDPSLKTVRMDGRFCHGHSSLARMSLRLYDQTGLKTFKEFYLHWLRTLDTPLDNKTWERWDSPAADELTFGELGIGMTMLSALNLVPVNWDGIYFLDV